MQRPLGLAATTLTALTACTSPPHQPHVRSWGTMRTVLREGNTQPRLPLRAAQEPGLYGVGALAELGGEVTVLNGRVLVAQARGGRSRITNPSPADAATLMVLAHVSGWSEHPITDVADYEELEASVGLLLQQQGYDLAKPTPIRILGEDVRARYHVIAGACPIANPTGPAPWRFEGAIPECELVGIFVNGAAGTWTHHARRSHLHVVGPDHMGHLEEVAVRNPVVLIPAR